MSTATLIRKAHDAGVSLTLNGEKIKVRGKTSAVLALTPELREHKADLLRWLQDAADKVRQVSQPGTPEEAALLTFRLLNAAMHVCDSYGDGEAAREAMRQQCLETPEHLQADLLETLRFIRKPEAKAPPPPPKKAPEPPADPQQWRELAAAYRNHHTGCKTCCAAGQGRGQRCDVGRSLWVNYQSSI